MVDNHEAASRTRLDQALVDRGYFGTRSRARDAILRGAVTVDGRLAAKPGQPVGPDCRIGIDDPAHGYVSRAALKLTAGLDHFGIRPEGRIALDIGASTGGFTQVLLERGASQVFAIDVGHGQLDAAIEADARVTSLEGVNARDLTAEHLGGVRPQIIVCDVSFISLRLALPPALALAAAAASGVFLVKPQFEAGRDAIGKGGLLRDPDQAGSIALELSRWLDDMDGWRSLGIIDSPVAGGDGNREFLLGGVCER